MTAAHSSATAVAMKGYWTQPSLSRDFTLLSVAVFVVLFVVSTWVTYITYARHNERIGVELKTEAGRIEQTLANEMKNADYLLTALGRQIVVNNARDLVQLAQILKSFDSKNQIYTVFNWISVDQKVLVSSNRGILEKPVDISDRDFVRRSVAEPWKMQIGRPIEGRISNRWVIPVVMGLTDYTGKFIGTILISLDISQLTEQISNLVRRDGISFAIISKTLIPLTQVSEDKNFLTNNFPAEKLVDIDFGRHPSGLLSQGNMFWGTGSYTYYAVSPDFPYIILMGYDNRFQDETVRNMLWSRLMQMVVIASFFILFLLIVRNRMIKPVMDITLAVSEVARGRSEFSLPTSGPIEINALTAQVQRISEYIKENKRIENELRNKMFTLKRSKDEMDLSKHSKSEFLAYICQEMRAPLNTALGCAQVMKDQLYGAIENKKYRQYAADIYNSCNHVMTQLDDVLVLSKTEAHYTVLKETIIDISATVNKAVRALADRLQSEAIEVKVEVEDPTLLLYADEFRVQQMVTNILLHHMDAGFASSALYIFVKPIVEKKDRQGLAIIITDEAAPTNIAELLRQQDQMSEPNSQEISLELVRRLVSLHQGSFYEIALSWNKNLSVITFPSTRLRFLDA